MQKNNTQHKGEELREKQDVEMRQTEQICSRCGWLAISGGASREKTEGNPGRLGLRLEQENNGYYEDEEAGNELVVYRSENM